MASAQLDKATQDKIDKFFADTQGLHKEMAMKRAEQRAIMQAEKPDPEKAGKLAGELFDLRVAIQAKAKAAGVENYVGPHGGGMGGCMGGPGGMMGGRGGMMGGNDGPGPR